MCFAVAQAHAANVAKVLAQLNADIISVNEVEGCFMLFEVLKHNSLEAQGYQPYLVSGTDSGTSQNVGMISKLAPTTALHRTKDRVAYP